MNFYLKILLFIGCFAFAMSGCKREAKQKNSNSTKPYQFPLRYAEIHLVKKKKGIPSKYDKEWEVVSYLLHSHPNAEYRVTLFDRNKLLFKEQISLAKGKSISITTAYKKSKDFEKTREIQLSFSVGKTTLSTRMSVAGKRTLNQKYLNFTQIGETDIRLYKKSRRLVSYWMWMMFPKKDKAGKSSWGYGREGFETLKIYRNGKPIPLQNSKTSVLRLFIEYIK